MTLSVTLNGVSFAGTVFASDATRRAPQKVDPKPRKVGDEITGIDGSLNIMLENAGAAKTNHELFWQGAPEVTRLAVYNTWLLATTFTAILPYGTYTVQCGLEDYEQSEAFTLPNGTRYFDVTLRLRDI